MNVDDVGLVVQAENFYELGKILNEDLEKVYIFFKFYHFTLNPDKSTSIGFI